MHREAASSAPYLRKQHMQLGSKMRFLGARWVPCFADDLWLRNAAHANAMAARLADGLAGSPGVKVVYPVQSDAVFAHLDRVTSPRSTRIGRSMCGTNKPQSSAG